MNDEESIKEYLKGLKVGDKVKLACIKRKWTVKAVSERYIILTQPFNLKHTVLYTIIDLKRMVRGTDNLIFGHGYETDEDIEDAISLLREGKMGVSYRNFVPIDIDLPF
ncbi:MAG TPA: hypothetical protein DCM01_07525 [Dielma fastidiosa]|jgi:hypothetical protein|nr:hypothetical protein [Dielma fastidiosa]